MEKCNLPNADIRRYSRQLILPQFGPAGQYKLRTSRILIVGCGGLGCPAAVYLAAAGVGTLGLVDDDIVELNNLHRQVGHTEAMVGQPKTTSLARRCRELNSTVIIEEHRVHLNSGNAVQLVSSYDLVLDCSDNLATRYLINDACAVCGPKPLVSGSALRLEGQMTVYLANRVRTPEEIEQNRPLLAKNRAPCFRCLYPVPPAADTVHGCSEAGVFGVVPGIIGTMQAAECIKILTEIESVESGRLFILDTERNLTRTVLLRQPRSDCEACGVNASLNAENIHLKDYVTFCGAPDHDKPPNINLKRFHNRISVQDLNELRCSNKPHILIDLRPEIEVQICRLIHCLYFPMKTLLRDNVLSTIQMELEIRLKKTTERPIPIVLLCHRGNDSQLAAEQLASALLSFQMRSSRTALDTTMDVEVGEQQQEEEEGSVSTTPDFVVCDVGGGLSAWASEVDHEFPVY